MALAWPMIRELMAICTRLDECLDENRVLGISPAGGDAPGGAFSPVADLFEDDRGVVLVLEVPGLDPAELSVAVSGDRLRVAGTTASNRSAGRFLRMERREGGFCRELQLPLPVSEDDVKATVVRGVLTVVMGRRDAGARVMSGRETRA